MNELTIRDYSDWSYKVEVPNEEYPSNESYKTTYESNYSRMELRLEGDKLYLDPFPRDPGSDEAITPRTE